MASGTGCIPFAATLNKPHIYSLCFARGVSIMHLIKKNKKCVVLCFSSIEMRIVYTKTSQEVVGLSVLTYRHYESAAKTHN